MNKNKFLICFSALLLLLMYKPVQQIKANDSNAIQIDTFPKDLFLQLSNLKPGDKIIAPIEVFNKGTLHFSYKTTAEYVEGSKKYYNAIIIEIKDKGNQILYSGSLGDFKGLAPRSLAATSSERLNFKIEIPYELGNEYQGLYAQMKIIFVAEGMPSDGDPGTPGNPGDPVTPGNPGNPDDPGNPGNPGNPGDPGNPGNPDNPGNPNNPSDPSNPGNPENPQNDGSPTNQDGDPSNSDDPTEPSDPTNPKNPIPTDKTQNLLPNTAINIFNTLFIGAILLCIGAFLLLYYRRLQSKH